MRRCVFVLCHTARRVLRIASWYLRIIAGMLLHSLTRGTHQQGSKDTWYSCSKLIPAFVTRTPDSRITGRDSRASEARHLHPNPDASCHCHEKAFTPLRCLSYCFNKETSSDSSFFCVVKECSIQRPLLLHHERRKPLSQCRCPLTEITMTIIYKK
jgi:hypothetical protein